MNSIETEVCEVPGKRDRKGRRMLGEKEWYRLMADYDVSGLTQEAYCKREAISYHTFVAWLGRRRQTVGPVAKAEAKGGKFHELRIPSVTAGSAGLEVILPNGMRLRGERATDLAQLVNLLGAYS